jgi:hypothetical protein
MKLQPVKEKTAIFYDVETYEDILQCCDSYIAVLDQSQIDSWFKTFNEITSKDDAQEYTEFGSTSLVFEVDGKNLVVVSDSGGEFAGGYFAEFCEENNIEYQFVIDSLDCEDIEVDEIYTGEIDDNVELLTLLHKVYN